MIKLVNILREGKTVSIFDFDDTLVKSLAWVYVKKNGKTVHLENEITHLHSQLQTDVMLNEDS